jgi:hypothetical protein
LSKRKLKKEEVMKKNRLFLFFLVTLVIISSYGCVKVTTYTHERVDLDIQGNRGYLLGSPPAMPSRLEKPDRKVLQFEITLPGPKEENIAPSQNREIKQKEISEPVYQPQVKPKKSTPKIK